jgi:hypothetical protein
VPWLGGLDLGLSLFYTALLLALIVVTFVTLARR